MSKQKPTIPQGTRDFGPEEMLGREFIFDTLRRVFKRYGYQPLETPCIEQLDVLTGKYGEEGDRLIFKILNSGDFLRGVEPDFDYGMPGAAHKLLTRISEKALRYDLTVPFARYVVMNQHLISFPFKRYQIQPVWRADKPQKGRYREFYQCDVDVVGANGLLSELELVRICDEGFHSLGLEGVLLRLNNRKLLEGIASHFGAGDRFVEFITILDKLDKVGEEGVFREWNDKGFSIDPNAFAELKVVSSLDAAEALPRLKVLLASETNSMATSGLEELTTLFEWVSIRPLSSIKVQLDIFLARGLSYYTGTIFEAGTHDFRGSILGGGRYDNLTGVFGLSGVSGVGISFGADRIYDILRDRGVLSNLRQGGQKVMLVNFGGSAELKAVEVWMDLLGVGVSAEIYPEAAKPGKQFKYADQAGFTHVIAIGDSELAAGKAKVKTMTTGMEESFAFEELPRYFRSL